jgi:hypothetical protein
MEAFAAELTKSRPAKAPSPSPRTNPFPPPWSKKLVKARLTENAALRAKK